jgi:hypothetical protein
MQIMGFFFLVTVIPLILWMPIQAVRRREIRLVRPIIISQDRHPVWFWMNVLFLTLCGVTGLLVALGAIFWPPR